ncbi:hypothetical protein L228DRAFT_238488 [Xylona heveae TC161]|uniref:C2H2-type domain-containing protein n=1 Tax=Xylona heveae (strain CBS 132557 / TC161) TaxID=1328760 RepID=A0A165GSJ5_XYLHT|nr:hypothetical protein L228DRAFT_238488 [Xylona heveae TC161]KZF22543.1 hypothetical protein L228DRAFT_238488 [Xylona heveae TC161]
MAPEKLHEAINLAELERLQIVLQDLCKAVPQARTFVEQQLLVSESDIGSSGTEGSDSDSDSSTPRTTKNRGSKRKATDHEDLNSKDTSANGSSNKRQRLRYAFCTNCKEEFDVADNRRGDCIFHDGELEPDYDDFFADHDENIHGDIDSDFCKEAYPEGYTWSCCDGEGIYSEGCHKGKHDVDHGHKPHAQRPNIWD